MPAAGAADALSGRPQLPEHIETQRTQVICGTDLNYHVSSVLRSAVSPSCAKHRLKGVFCRRPRQRQQTCTWHWVSAMHGIFENGWISFE